jgi:hypothetical protein
VSTDENITDRHDEPDSTQFGNDHDLAGTHFIGTHCHTCGTYVVKDPAASQALCIDCRRTQAGITWQSGDNIGDHHPNPPTEPLNTTAYKRGHTLTPGTKPHQWRWGCLYCLETGQADNPTHATALHKIHLGYACPGTPGLNPTEIRLRLARRTTRQNLYPHEVPPFTPNNKTE